MAKIRLCGVGMEMFTGHMGSTYFENGVSVEDVSPVQIRLLGALTTIMVLDGEKEYQGGSAADTAANRSTGYETKKTWLEPDELAALDAEVAKTVAPFEQGEVNVAAVQTDAFKSLANTEPAKPNVKVYSREELEMIADEKGLKGLREIGDVLGVKGTAIITMIETILAAQKANQ